jgi:hypothetical protein
VEISAYRCSGNPTSVISAYRCSGNPTSVISEYWCSGNPTSVISAYRCSGNPTFIIKICNMGLEFSGRIQLLGKKNNVLNEHLKTSPPQECTNTLTNPLIP